MTEITNMLADSIKYGLILTVVELVCLIIATLGFNKEKQIQPADIIQVMAKFYGLNIIFVIILNKVV